MSSIAAAKKRRSNIQPPVAVVPPTPPATGLTLQQVISLIDKRLVALETTVAPIVPVASSDYLDEFNARSIMLAEEITSLKDIVLNLQSYTMEVNKTLMDERNKFFNQLLEERKQPDEFTFSQPSDSISVADESPSAVMSESSVDDLPVDASDENITVVMEE